MELTLSSPTVLFPAVSLLLLAFTNRFLHLSALVRSLHAGWLKGQDPVLRAQVSNLKKRIDLIRWCQALGVLSLIGCLGSMLCMFASFTDAAASLFAASVVLMLLSLLACLWEIMISGRALDIFLNQMTTKDD